MADVRPKQISQEGATSGQVLEWDGSKWTPATPSGSASSLADTLAVGDNTGANDIEVEAAQTVKGVDETSASGGDLNLRAGDHTGASGSIFNGGDVVIDGGDTDSTNGNSKGGDVLITAGTASGSSVNGGDVVISGGQPTGLGFSGGGSVTLRGADGSTAGGNTPGGDVSIICGDAKGASALGGSFSVTCGDSPTGTGSAGSIIMAAGANAGAGLANSGGDVSISAGDSNGRSGDVTITSGNNTDSVNSNNAIGNISIGTGTSTGTATTWTGGSIDISCNGDTSGGTDGVTGGNLSLSAGDTGVSSQDGGDVAIRAGNTFGFNGRKGGAITLTAGDENNGNQFSLGGVIDLVPGTSAGGDDGQVFVKGTGSLAMSERASAVPMTLVIPAAGFGRWWVRNDAPNVPMFTDDTGVDHVLNDSGAETLQDAYVNGNQITTSAAEGDFDVTGTESINLSTTGTSNGVTLSTQDDGDIDPGSAVTIKTTSGFAGQGIQRFEFGDQIGIGSNVSNQAVVTLATLASTGDNVKIISRLTAQDNAEPRNFIGFKWENYYWNGTGSPQAAANNENQQSNNGLGGWNLVTFSVDIVGFDIVLRVTNLDLGLPGYNINISLDLEIQYGGASS